MGRTKGVRAGTRDMFSRGFRQKGPEKLSTYLFCYKVGDIVDIKVNGAIHKGMPHKFYHGKTGIVYNVSRTALGVIMNKQVGNRIIKKRINVRVEHLKHSKCREEFLVRKIENEKRKAQGRVDGVKVDTKRYPKQPLPAHTVKAKGSTLSRISAMPYAGLE
ncbi:60S ribosomal protein L21-A [Sphaeroforma arctica JP610]|uniref:60S ribosomal protein L21-A n=1 Tax=Sphaeroforma arctica JP610 TaxID=667725 RepID=A0A0L0FXA2_9EUKA|nr:60S ribosomal protein L21-A [Sphaeroforma arctica JP610]KNC81176.1 60S ribosomal protein L21-A [Sphaeroforma arctica JP610]|eukprot:XP_014155078.1 60S ribosomal protein L21-A [Sphaeroforma arctica JP610]